MKSINVDDFDTEELRANIKGPVKQEKAA